ncbi:hypothetical protein NDU88_006387 [Pleurodeles waltl]|uniref:Uncharacterized protein n=1 Tax=Pleurodeles waltl TaxID=8319 RepID=A0AAV7MCT9_PLEWA|nr:hypothetical protein NDU88_006387 [Pleurodeles waltl]
MFEGRQPIIVGQSRKKEGFLNPERRNRGERVKMCTERTEKRRRRQQDNEAVRRSWRERQEERWSEQTCYALGRVWPVRYGPNPKRGLGIAGKLGFTYIKGRREEKWYSL